MLRVPFLRIICPRLTGTLVAALLGAALLPAAPLERDLGQGLLYVRVRELPADIPAKPGPGSGGPCVVDLRYVPAEADAAAAFQAWLDFRATRRTPVFVLVNPETSPALLKLLAARKRATGSVVIGPASGDFLPDIVVKGSPDKERQAYDALARGVPVAKVLADNPDKVRNDEASLSRDRLAHAAAETAGDLLAGKPEEVPIDLTLQRAVHLHRALAALKKI